MNPSAAAPQARSAASAACQLLCLSGRAVAGVARLTVLACLIRGEPLLRFMLLPFALGCVWVVVVLGVLMHLPGLPLGGLLGLAVAAVVLYLLWWKLIALVS